MQNSSLLFTIKQKKNLFILLNCVVMRTQLSAKSWTLSSLVNVFCPLENEIPAGHYRRVTLFWLCHGLIHLSLPVLSLMIGTSITMVISSSWNSSLPLCQGQLQRFTAAKQENTAACIKYKQAEHGETANLLRWVFYDIKHAADWSLNDCFLSVCSDVKGLMWANYLSALLSELQTEKCVFV